MPYSQGRTIASARLLGTLFTFFVLPVFAEPVDIKRPAQPLSAALREFARQTGVQVAIQSELADGKTSPSLDGKYEPADALSALLKGTGLTAYPVNQNTYGIREVHSTTAKSDKIRAVSYDPTNNPIRLAQTSSSDSPRAPRGSNSSEEALEEIVVTAQKRAQNLQDVPISISAIGGERIRDLGLQNLNDLMGMVPGVSFTAVAPGINNLVIRGLATADLSSGGFDANRSEAVGIYIDDTPIGQPANSPDISPFDLERVEVLRGPQGTLYGSGSLAGTIRYITRKPDTHEFQSKLGVDASTTERGGFNRRVDAMVNIPLADTLAVRAIGYHVFDDGYIRGVGPANSGRDANNARQYGGRAALRWQATSDFTADASVMIQRVRSDLSPQDNIGYQFSHGVPVGPYEQYRYSPQFNNTKFNLYNLTLEYALGWGKLHSSTSYVRDGVDNANDFNATIQLFFKQDLHSGAFIFNNKKDFSEELRLATDLAGPLNFVGGAYFIHSHRWAFETHPTPGFDAAMGIDSTALGVPADDIFVRTLDIGERQTALFGELTYAMTPKLSATAGLRWFNFNQDYSIATAGFISNGNPPLDRVHAEHGVNPKFLVSYKVSDDALLSAQASRGFRLGGTNDRVPQALCGAGLAALGLTAAPETFKSENVWNYELDAKTAWNDRRLTVNGSLYYIDYKNVQVQTNPAGCGFPFMTNAATATSKGVELELAGKPLPGLEMTLSGAYTDATLSADAPSLGGKAGDQLPLSAKVTANATARYDVPIHDSLLGFVQYSYRYNGPVIFSLGYQANPAASAQPAPGYQLHNIRVGIADRGWQASLYLNNVFDQTVINYRIILFSEPLRSLGQPRTGGLSVTYSW